MPFWLLYSILLNVVFSQSPLRLSGISDGDLKVMNVTQNTKLTFGVLGHNLPTEGYYFTTATKCEDYQLTNLSDVSTVLAKVEFHECSRIVLSVENGLPFNATGGNIYKLCNLNATSENPALLVVNKVDHKLGDIGNKVILCCFAILMCAYSSGMTLGYMKFSIIELNRMITGGGPQAKHARRILRFRRRSNWLVVAFSLFSSIFTVVFTMTVEKMLYDAPSVLKILVPTLILFLFAEMLPQAICNSKFGFNLASGLWFVSVLIFLVTAPISWPASRLLERYLKRNVREVLTQEEKMCMIRNMAKNAKANEKTIIENATTFSLKRVEELMVPIQDVFMLSTKQKLNRSTIITLVEKGYTRVPVCDEKNRNTIVGLLNMKDLVLMACDLRDEPKVEDVLKRIEQLKDSNKQKKFVAKHVSSEMSAQLLLGQMKKGDFHFACVVKYMPYESKIIGIITIEDILEELFGKIDSRNENRVRSSVDDRGDNAVIGWCREAGSDLKYPLLFTQQLRVLQYLLKECTVFQKLDIGILKAKQLLSVDRIKTAEKNTSIYDGDALIVVWKGKIKVTNARESFEQNVDVPDAEVTPPASPTSWSPSQPTARPTLPVFVIGKQVLNKLTNVLRCSFVEPIEPKDDIWSVVVVSEQASYFELRLENLLETINDSDSIKRFNETPAASPAVRSVETTELPREEDPLLGNH